MLPLNLKNKLAYVCKHKRGYTKQLVEIIGNDCIQQFETIGFISQGFNSWRKTKLADRYYKDVYGLFSYYIMKFKKDKL